jgi:hypothetical protein
MDTERENHEGITIGKDQYNETTKQKKQSTNTIGTENKEKNRTKNAEKEVEHQEKGNRNVLFYSKTKSP